MIKTKGTPEQILRLMVLGSYDRAIAWVACEDNNGDDDRLNQDALIGYLTVALIADLFGKEAGEVAHDVVTLRRRGDKAKEIKVLSSSKSSRTARTYRVQDGERVVRVIDFAVSKRLLCYGCHHLGTPRCKHVSAVIAKKAHIKQS